MTARRFATERDLLDPELHARGEIVEALAAVRAIAPVAWCPGRRGPGYWSVTGHAELLAAARDVDAFSSFWGTRPEVTRPAGACRPLHNLDPPDHDPLRRIASRAVAAERLDALAPVIAATAGDAVATLVARGQGDAIGVIAEPVAARVFAAWLGLPAADAPALWAHVAAVHAAGAALLDTAARDPARRDREAAARDASTAMARFMADALGAATSASLLGALGRQAGADALGLAILFVEAGLPTVVDAVGGALDALLDTPETRLGDADLAPAIEELLRRGSPIAQFARRARRDARLGEVTIAEGEQVVLWFVAANHDPRVFADPLRTIWDRAPNPHVAFGVGPHRCLGAALARRILRAVVRAWGEHRFERAGPAVRRPSSYLRGCTHLPVQLA